MGGPGSVICFTRQHRDKSWCVASQGVAVDTCLLIVLLVITFEGRTGTYQVEEWMVGSELQRALTVQPGKLSGRRSAFGCTCGEEKCWFCPN